jgi:hypothetical protein
MQVPIGTASLGAPVDDLVSADWLAFLQVFRQKKWRYLILASCIKTLLIASRPRSALCLLAFLLPPQQVFRRKTWRYLILACCIHGLLPVFGVVSADLFAALQVFCCKKWRYLILEEAHELRGGV